MKRIWVYLAFLFVCGTQVSATVDLTLSYDVRLYNSYYKDGQDLVKTAQSHNEDVSNFSTRDPYNGGSDFTYREDVERYQLAALFFDRPGMSNWTTNTVSGTLSVGNSTAFPEGSLVPCVINYEFLENEGNNVFPRITSGISIWESDFSNILYIAGGKTTSVETVYLTAGQDYIFYAGYSAGDKSHRFSGHHVAGIQYSFEAIPEPATVTFVCMGMCFLLRNRKGCEIDIR